MRGDASQRRALTEALLHEPEAVLFEVAQAAMHQLGARAARPAREVIALVEGDAQPAQCGVARDAGAVDPAPHDDQIETGSIGC